MNLQLQQPTYDALFDIPANPDPVTFQYSWTKQWEKYGKTIAFITLLPIPNVLNVYAEAGRRLGYAEVSGVSLFSAQLRDFTNLRTGNAEEYIGDKTDQTIREICWYSDTVVACWGGHGSILDRDKAVLKMLRRRKGSEIQCFGHTSQGKPLIVPADVQKFSLKRYHGKTQGE